MIPPFPEQKSRSLYLKSHTLLNDIDNLPRSGIDDDAAIIHDGITVGFVSWDRMQLDGFRQGLANGRTLIDSGT